MIEWKRNKEDCRRGSKRNKEDCRRGTKWAMRGIQPDTMLRATKAHVTCVVLMLVLFVSREATEAQEGE